MIIMSMLLSDLSNETVANNFMNFMLRFIKLGLLLRILLRTNTSTHSRRNRRTRYDKPPNVISNVVSNNVFTYANSLIQAISCNTSRWLPFVPPAQSASESCNDELMANLNNCFGFSPHTSTFFFTHSSRGVELNRVRVTL
jgi:hypothetical protein